MLTPNARLIRRVLGGLLVVLALVATSCASDIVKDYGDQAKHNFVDACTTERSVKDGKVTVTHLGGDDQAGQLRQKNLCTCVYGKISASNGIAFGDLTDYEGLVAKADPGDAPKPPAKLTSAIQKCEASTVSGPKVPATTTTRSG